MSNEHKSISFQFEAKEADTGDMTIKGYGSVFGNIDQGGDVMVAGCFSETLRKRMPKMAWQHSTWDLCGVWTVAQEDSKGLYLEGKFANTTLGRDAYELAKMGAIDGLSIGYAVRESDREEDGRRMLKEVDLYEVSLVTFPMNEQATITQVKNEIKTIREFEAALRDVLGFSKSRAKAIAAHGFNDSSSRRDDGLDEVSEALTKLNQLLGVSKND